MIKVKMHGRLGNQFFQYAFARAIQEITNEEIVVDFKEIERKGNEKEGWKDNLKDFNVVDYSTYRGKIPFIFWRQSLIDNIQIIMFYLRYSKYSSLSDIYEKQIENIEGLSRKGIYWLSNGYYPFDIRKKNIMLNGSFEDVRFFNHIRQILIREFTPRKSPSPRNKEMINQIRSLANPVCITIRTFKEIKKDSNKNSLYDVMDPDYYDKAIKKMDKLVPDATYFVFSDDIEWVKENIDFHEKKVIYEPEENPVWENLRLMYTCNHFIISNSTFSWWAQYLSQNDSKIVISPSKWFNNDFQPNIMDSNWLHI